MKQPERSILMLRYKFFISICVVAILAFVGSVSWFNYHKELTTDIVNNLSYRTSIDKLVKLTDGKAKYTAYSGVAKDGKVFSEEGFMGIANVAFGDLNGDRKSDAAVLLMENGGGTGYYYRLAVVRKVSGVPVVVTTINVLDDRPTVHSLTIEEGTIVLDANISGPDDAAIDNTVHTIDRYKLLDDSLVAID